MEPDAEEILPDGRVGQIDEGPPRRRLAVEPIDPRSSPDDVRIEPEPAEHVKPGRLDRDPGADGLRVGTRS